MSDRSPERKWERVQEVSGLAEVDLDRLAVALALAEEARELPPGVRRLPPSLELEAQVVSSALDEPYGEPVLTALLREAGLDSRRALARGRALLAATAETCRWDWLETVVALASRGGELIAGAFGEVAVELGRDEAGGSVRWVVNLERGAQTNANLRLAGMPGMGKSQFLLHLLAGALEASPGTGLLLLDYKGDLAGNPRFVESTGARVVHLGREPLPLNPFRVPQGLNPTLLPRTYAEVFSAVAPGLGEVQKDRIYRAMREVFRQDGEVPTLKGVARAVRRLYEREGAGRDSVLAALDMLVELELFSDEGPGDGEDLLRCRQVLDLSRLHSHDLRLFVASVVLQHYNSHVQTLPDAAFDRESGLRRLRGIVAVDEAHYYLRFRCLPLLQLIRVGRSKGVPVFLSSQSLEDFRDHTELDEFLPNTFLFRHGRAPARGTLQGVLGVSRTAAGEVADRLTRLEQFHAFTRTGGADPLSPVRVKAYFENQAEGGP